MRQDIDSLTELLAELNSEDGWTKSLENKDGTKVYFKREDGSPMLMTKLESIIHCETSELSKKFIDMLTLLNESDLMPKWFPMGIMKANDTLTQPTVFSKLSHIKINLPFPLNRFFGPRDMIIRGKGYDLAERKSAAISIEPLEQGAEVYGVTIPGPDSGWTRAVFKGAYYFEMSREGIIFKQMQLIDMKSRFIPTPLMNWLSKGELPVRQFRTIRSKINSLAGSEWEERTKADAQGLYKDVGSRLQETVEREFL